MESVKEKEEKKIPVLAVEKNGVIVKNIILNSPVYKSESEQEQSENSEKSSQKEEKLLVGRHPDCHIVLDHPSVSRFHLQIQFETSSQKLYINDLSSVHGTWVSGQKIEPRIPVELQEGNTLRVGASTRVYRLQWVPLKWAFQIDSPQMSTLQEDQEYYQDNNSISSLWPKQIPSAPPLLEREENHSPPRRSKQRGSSSIWSRRGKPLGSLRIQTGRTEEKIAVNFAVDAEARNCEETMNLEQGKTQNGFEDPFSEVLCADLGMEADIFPSDKDNLIPNIQLSLKSEKKPENGNLRVESSRLGLQGQFSEVLHINSPMDEEVFCSDKENSLPLGLKSRKRPENGNSIVKASRLGLLGSPSEVFLSNLAAEEEKFSSDKENSTPKTSIGLQSKKKSVCGNLKMVEPLKIQRSYSKVLFSNSEMVEEGFSCDKENLTPRISLGPKSNKKSAHEKLTMEAESFSAAIQQQEQEVVQNEFESSCSKVLFSNSEIAKDGFSSDKENVTQIIPFGMKSNKESVCGNSNMEANIFSTAGPEHRKQDAMKPEFQSSCSKVLFPNSEMVEDGFSSDKENLTQKILLRLKSNKKSVSGNSKKEAKITQPELQEQEVTQKEFQSSCSKVLFSNSEIAEDGFSSDKENVMQIIPFGMKSNKESVCGNSNIEANIFTTSPEHRKQEAMKLEFQSSCSKVLFPNSEMVEDGFSSDKENLTPKIPLGLKLNKKSVSGNSKKEAKITQPELQGVFLSNLDVDESIFPSDKENLTPHISNDLKSNKKLTTDYPAKSRHELKISRRVAERAPFQVLLTNSPCNNSKAVLTATSRNSNSITTSRKRTPSAEQSVDQTFQKAREAKKLWNMVVDTSCFLNEESRRSLKLLEGLRGTHLIIPRMVIRELDSLKRPGSRFRKPNVASLILQWIEECMVKTKWWIHVQNSAESLPIAETPPASPSQRLSEGSNEFAGSIPFSTHGSFLQLVTPTAEDHILECALLFKKIKTDGHLVLLTNDVALKIKAMAEGLICETPKEFCESLVNPYSERFLWMESTPRGPTWSSLDFQCSIRITEKCGAHEEDAVRRRAAEGAKGLKLILLHNSHYGHQINSVK